jgi:hypothetical protein
VSLSSGRGVTSIGQAPLVEEKAPFRTKRKSGRNKSLSSVPTGSEAKNDFAGKSKQQFTGLGCSVPKAELICTEALILSLAEIRILPSYCIGEVSELVGLMSCRAVLNLVT